MRRAGALLVVLALVLLCVACGTSNNILTTPEATNAPPSPSGGGNGGSGGSGSGSPSIVSYAYSANTTTVYGYGVNADGSLSAVPNSPYAVNSASNLSPSGWMVTNGSNLYTIASGGTNLSIFSIAKSNGSLTAANTTSAIAGDPNSSDMASGLSLDGTGSSLYIDVGLSDLDGGVNVFSVSSNSSAQQVQYLAGPAIAPPPLVFAANNQYAYTWHCAARVEGIFGYARGADGTLRNISTGNVQSPVSSAGTSYCPIGIAASAQGLLAIVWTPFQFASSVPVGNQVYVGTYTINSDGTLTLVANSGVTTASTSTAAAAFDPSGTYLAVAGNGGVQTYAMSSSGILSSVSSPQAAGVNFQSVAWDKSGHAFASASSQLYVFNSANGMLTAASGSPHNGGPGLTVLPLQ